MSNQRAFTTRERIINEGAARSSDPRIDSPEIKVVYPPEEIIEGNIEQPKEPILEVAPKTEPTKAVEEQPHECKIGVQKAIEQNWIAFSIAAIALVGIGYLIGKSRAV